MIMEKYLNSDSQYIHSRKDTQKVIKAPCNTKQHRDLNNLFFVSM